jgi:mRNA interferase MazF
VVSERREGFRRGDILWVELPIRMPPGREQAGRRPAVVVGVPEDIEPIPYRVLVVVPLTRTRTQGILFPVLSTGAGGLPADSTALICQVLALDVRRAVGRIGQLTAAEYAPIRSGLARLLDFETTCPPQQATAAVGDAEDG